MTVSNAPTIIHDRFLLLDVLGKGGFAVVYKCEDLVTRQFYAAKVIKKTKLSKREMAKLDTEGRLHGLLKHPNIVRLHHVISLDAMHVFLMDLITGGELFDDLVTREDNYTEDLAAKCIFQILEALAYCHQMGVIHRDLKPENILLKSKEEKIIKLADFGLAVESEGDEVKLFGISGTPNYMAPEVLEMKPYGNLVDCWSCGVIMYILITGRLPFYNEDPRKMREQIKMGSYTMDSQTWSAVTSEGRDLLKQLLCVVPAHRLSAKQALKHAWFRKIRAMRMFQHRNEEFENLKKFNARRKMKAAINSTVFISKVQFILAAKRKVNKLDSKSTSTLTVKESKNKSLAKKTGK